MFQLEVII